MNRDDAEEYTQGLGQVLAGSYRQVALGVKLGVPEALELSTAEWVQEHLGGYVKLAVPERREAVKELLEEGFSQRETGEILGVAQKTVSNDSRSEENYSTDCPDQGECVDIEENYSASDVPDEPEESDEPELDFDPEPEPEDPAIAADRLHRLEEEREERIAKADRLIEEDGGGSNCLLHRIGAKKLTWEKADAEAVERIRDHAEAVERYADSIMRVTRAWAYMSKVIRTPDTSLSRDVIERLGESDRVRIKEIEVEVMELADELRRKGIA